MKKILVALDGSPREGAVLDAGIRMARPLGASLILLRVIGVHVDMPLELVRVSPADFEVLMLERAKAAVSALGKMIPASIEWVAQVVTGVAWDAICRAAKDDDVDLVVIGAHGYGRLDRVLGTTASRIVNHLDRSVLVVRDEARLETESTDKKTEKKS